MAIKNEVTPTSISGTKVVQGERNEKERSEDCFFSLPNRSLPYPKVVQGERSGKEKVMDYVFSPDMLMPGAFLLWKEGSVSLLHAIFLMAALARSHGRASAAARPRKRGHATTEARATTARHAAKKKRHPAMTECLCATRRRLLIFSQKRLATDFFQLFFASWPSMHRPRAAARR